LFPLYCFYPMGALEEFELILFLVVVLLVYSAFDVKKLIADRQKDRAIAFVCILGLTILLSYATVAWMIRIFGPKFLI